MVQVGGFADSLSKTSSARFACLCGVDVEWTGALEADPVSEINGYVQNGAPAKGSISISPPLAPTPQYFGSGAKPGVYLSVNIARSMLGLPDEPPPAPEEPPEPGPELRALEGSVIGYRAWRIKDWVLTGTGVDEAWAPGINEAKCCNSYVFGHVSPHEACHCGMYALARFDDKTSWWNGADVLGAVEAWADPDEHNHDRFFVHSTGFRAQYAKVILLATSDDYPRAKNAAIRSLAAEHGADVCRREHLEDAAKEHGQLVPDDWLAWAKEDEPEDSWASIANIFASQARSISNLYSLSNPAVALTPRRRPRPPSRKGIKQTLGYPGPPASPISKHSKGDRIRDSKGVVWCCQKGGKPGLWERETDSA